ncbi:hypothetical protein F5Y05DRAFT_138279 [Hypoxylon sp. FL0543]|nr:hypothetical protein F5Y05DRAFT_138279 [Hypoxylon sp. FL0543]
MEGSGSQSLGTSSNSSITGRGSNSRGRSSRGRGNYGSHHGRGSGHGRGQRPGGSHAPSADSPNPTTAPSHATPSNSNNRGGRGQRGNRGLRRGQRGGNPNVPRSFGIRLTTDLNTSESDLTSVTRLNVNAQEFVPGQSLAGNSGKSTVRPMARSNQSRKASKSTAPDLPTRIHEDITNGQYECVVCTNEVLPNSVVWSCPVCWTVTHMSCVRKWYSSRERNATQEQNAWRCPGCNSQMSDDPGFYHCWCGKDDNPRSIPGLNPHSCGQTCSKPRATCPHPCPMKCHAGPCPPCQAMGPSQPCFCGKRTSTKRCTETDYTHGWSCHQVCGDPLPCGEHDCQRECHVGLCGSCKVPILSLCYCGRESKQIPCDERGDKRASYNYGQVENGVSEDDNIGRGWFSGSFQCNSICGRAFDCGKHHCEKNCHPQDENAAHCPFSPDMIAFCPCGKKLLADLTNNPREFCTDPVPNCGQVCMKPLPCGHMCRDTCHSGPCSPCMQAMEISCRCGRTKTSSVCHQGDVAKPECMRICHAQLNCGRHEHGEHCCPGEKKAAERVAAKRKHRNTGFSIGEIEAEHICTRVCGRTLRCGRHQCEQLCHRGPCPSCPEAIWEEISCNCGKTILEPPQPCGTRPPDCHFDCRRPRPCGHPQIQHNCHLDDEPCPKCPFLVDTICVCGKKTLKNQPCWFDQPRCGLPCGRKLKCGAHECRLPCHPPGECEDANMVGSQCSQPCGKARICGHLDIEKCHAPYPCKEDKPCQAKTFITCECQRRKQEVKCMATKKNPSPDRGRLACDDECLRLQRNARLAEALNVDPQTHTDDRIPYSDKTLALYKENPQFAQAYERDFRLFAADPAQKLLRFKPMKSQQRMFLHSLAQDFGFDSESADPEPHRHVCLFKTPRFVSAPMKTIAQCLKTKSSAQQALSSQPSTSAGQNASAKPPFNALLLSAPRFGLTVDELDSILRPHYAAYPDIKFLTAFLNDIVIIKGSGPWRPQDLESSLSSLQPKALQTLKSAGACGDVFLCHVDEDSNIVRNNKDDNDVAGSGDGWSAVMRRSARPNPTPVPVSQPASQRNRFVALKRVPKKTEEKPAEEEVEDDWEAAAEKLDDEPK